jgi:hypothetical protein
LFEARNLTGLLYHKVVRVGLFLRLAAARGYGLLVPAAVRRARVATLRLGAAGLVGIGEGKLYVER